MECPQKYGYIGIVLFALLTYNKVSDKVRKKLLMETVLLLHDLKEKMQF